MSAEKSTILSGFCDGPWTGEPDEAIWTDEATGLECQIRRQKWNGSLCGYVVIPDGHPFHGKDYTDEIPELSDALAEALEKPMQRNAGLGLMLGALTGHLGPRMDHVLEVHGGITFSGTFRDDTEKRWIIGFDCNHCDDGSPRDPDHGYYRDMDYVRHECERLAVQVSKFSREAKP